MSDRATDMRYGRRGGRWAPKESKEALEAAAAELVRAWCACTGLQLVTKAMLADKKRCWACGWRLQRPDRDGLVWLTDEFGPPRDRAGSGEAA